MAAINEGRLFFRLVMTNRLASWIEQQLVAGTEDEAKFLFVVIALFPIEPQPYEALGEGFVNFWFGEYPTLLIFKARSEDAGAIIIIDFRISAAVADERVAHQKEWFARGSRHLQALFEGWNPEKFVSAADRSVGCRTAKRQ